jgi:hypothetical protein
MLQQLGIFPRLFRLAKIVNGYWYPSRYVAMALLLDTAEDTSWKDVDPALAVGAKFASAAGWNINVRRPLSKAGLLRQTPRRQSDGCAA